MSTLKDLIIQSVSAQEVDAVAQPTFGTITIRGGSQARATVLVSSDKSSVAVGQRFTVKVAINTGTNQISSYNITIDFDPSKLQVVDSNTSLAGTQVKKTDQVFQFQNEEQNNRVDSSGKIIINAFVQNPVSINTEVIEFEMQAQQAGPTTIKISEGSGGTQLTRQSGNALSYTINEVTIQVSSQQGTDGGTNNNGTDNGTNNGTGSNSGTNNGSAGTQSGTIVPSEIPNTSLISDPLSALILFVGIFFLYVGFRMSRIKSINN